MSQDDKYSRHNDALLSWTSIVILALIFLAIAYVGYQSQLETIDRRQEIVRSLIAPDKWLTVNDIYIEDTPVGQDPIVIVDRTIHTRFLGEWVVEILRLEKSKFVLVCAGNGKSDYAPGDNMPEKIKLLGWWAMVPNCKLHEGRYRACTRWNMHVPKYPVKIQSKCSNVFDMIDIDKIGKTGGG